MTILAFLVAIYAVGLLNVPAMREPFLRDRIARLPLAVYGHLAGARSRSRPAPFSFSPGFAADRSTSTAGWAGCTSAVCWSADSLD